MRVAFLAAGIMTLVAGCQSTEPKPKPDMSTCAGLVQGISDPRASPTTKQIIFEVARNRGCFGQPQEQRLRITS